MDAQLQYRFLNQLFDWTDVWLREHTYFSALESAKIAIGICEAAKSWSLATIAEREKAQRNTEG